MTLDPSAPYSDLNGRMVPTEQLRAVLDFEFDEAPKTQRDKELLWATYLAIYGTEEDLKPIESTGGETEESDQVTLASLEGFSPSDSLSYLKRIEELRAYATQIVRPELLSLTRAELRRLNAWLKDNPGEQRTIAEEIERWAHVGFPYEVLNEGLGKTLVVSYAFAPDMDTAGMVMARRIRTWGKVVSVMSNDLSATNKYDPECFQMCAPFVERQIKINAKPTVAKWRKISWFVRKGMKYIDENPKWFAQHDHLYSRVMLPPSHFLAAMIKLENPDIKWTAEFSDVLSTDTKNQLRYAQIQPSSHDPVYERLYNELAKSGLKEYAGDNAFLWGETLPYLLADEIVFVSDRHRQYMLDLIADPELREVVSNKSQVAIHPPPPDRFYNLSKTNIQLDNHKINIGFVGRFYPIRRLEEVINAFGCLSAREREYVEIHVISPNAVPVLKAAGIDPAQTGLVFHPEVTYFESLALQQVFDYMIINDMETKSLFPYNFYTASKTFDIRPDLTEIWGIVETGSILDSSNVSYKSEIGDVDGAVKVLRQLIVDSSRNLE